MADVTFTCPGCGVSVTVSEFTAREGRQCPACGAVWASVPARSSREPALHLRSREADDSTTLAGDKIGSKATMSGSAAPIQAGARLFAATEADRARSPSLVLGLVVLLLVGGAAVGGTWYVREHGEWRDVFLAARWFVLGVPALLVCLEAFQESAAQGMLCLLVPLYLVWYAITRVESYWRQALVLSALALLIAEYAWLRERSVITITSEVVHRFIEYVGASIRRAGEAGVF